MAPKRRPRQRELRGLVHVNTRELRLQLRWTVEGKRFYLTVGDSDDPLAVHDAHALAKRIREDIRHNQFDPTLQKYQPQPKLEPEPPKPVSTVELFERFMEYRRKDGTSGQSITARYKPLLSNLKRFGQPINTKADAQDFVCLLRSRQSARIANQNLSLLRGFGSWAVDEGFIQTNPFNGIKPAKQSKAVNSKRKPFTKDQVKSLLNKAKEHPRLCHWHDFCMTMLYLGLRPSEAIGLRWCDVDLTSGDITIASSLARDENGRSSGAARVRKDRKTDSISVLKAPPSLLAMLRHRKQTQPARTDDLIFTSPTGLPIDDHNFSKRTWKQLCAEAGVPYHVPYASRHTLLSHGIEGGGMSLQQAAYIAGHKDIRMVSQTYGHMINRPKLIDWQDE